MFDDSLDLAYAVGVIDDSPRYAPYLLGGLLGLTPVVGLILGLMAGIF